MKAAETIILWNDSETPWRETPPGSVAVGPVWRAGEANWTRGYRFNGGAGHTFRRSLTSLEQKFHVLRDFYELVYVFGLDPYLVHRAFLLIDEYQAITKDGGFGPAPGEIGHDPQFGYGRAVASPLPTVQRFQIGRSCHFWPADGQEVEHGL